MKLFLPYTISKGLYNGLEKRKYWFYIGREESLYPYLNLVDYSESLFVHIENKINHFLKRPIGYQDCKVTYLDDFIIDFMTTSAKEDSIPRRKFDYYVESHRPLSRERLQEIEDEIVAKEILESFPEFPEFIDQLSNEQEYQHFKSSFESNHDLKVQADEYIFPAKFDDLARLGQYWNSLSFRHRETFYIKNNIGDVEFEMCGRDEILDEVYD
jgi:hypothetical protein